MKLIRMLFVIVCFAWLLAGLTGCEKEGPMEKAGKKVDKAAAEVKKAAEETKDSVKNLFKKE